ncbi:hypothetical protein SAMN02910456_00474 [Ruminococcaceae bacterium YRB3002]|nr:hypothetical protein SAMN02910456_00474 [Ruminococcaceae bacterium YRB3002]
MTITGIDIRLIYINYTSEHSIEGDIPFTGEPVITQMSRSSFETNVKRYSMQEDTRDRFLELIDRYNITDWVGRIPAPPELLDSKSFKELVFITLKYDDGTSHKITFREGPENIGKEAAVEFKKLFYAVTNDENMISEEKAYPTLKECREIREDHGPVVAIETSFFSMGMMYGSNQTVTQTVEKVPGHDGEVLVTVEKKAGNKPDIARDSKTITSDIFGKVQEISDRENLPGWDYAAIDPSIPVDRSMMPLDYSSSSSITITYDDSLITGVPCVRRTIGESACKLGGKEVDRMLSEMVSECVAESGINVAMPQPSFIPVAVTPPGTEGGSQPMMGFWGMMQAQEAAAKTGNNETGATTDTADTAPNEPWTCSNCGQTGVTGKFCYNCGYPKNNNKS